MPTKRIESVDDQLLWNKLEEGCAVLQRDGAHAHPGPGVILVSSQSASLVKLIQLEYGTEALNHKVAALVDGAECENKITRSLGSSLVTLPEVRLLQHGPLPLLTRMWHQGGILDAVVVVGIILKEWFVLRLPPSGSRWFKPG